MPSPNDKNRAELAIVEMLADRIGTKLGDRDGDRHGPPWRPDQQVRIGVLRPHLVDPPEEGGESDTEEVDETTGDAGEAPPLEPTGIIGLDTMVSTTGDTITIEVDGAVSIYLPEFATYTEARDRQMAAEEAEEEAAELEAEAADEVDEALDAIVQAALAEPATGENSVPTEDAPASEEGSGDSAEDSAATEDAGGGEGGEGRRRRAGLPVWDAWRRQRIQVENMRVTIPLDGSEHEIAGQLRDAIRAAIEAHFLLPEASRPFTTATRTIPLPALNSEAEYWEALGAVSDSSWVPHPIDLHITVYAEPLDDDTSQVQLSVNLTNETVIEVPPMPTQDLAVYDAELRIRLVDGGAVEHQRFRLAPRDYRWHGADQVPGHGRGCAAVEDDDGSLRTETLPRFVQRRIEPRGDHVPAPRFDDLAADPNRLLLQISEAMRTFENGWRDWLGTVTDPDIVAVSSRDLEGFIDEHRRFDKGRDVLSLDERLDTAFRATNRVFSRLAGDSYDTWRLFQLVYVVLHLGALAAREHPQQTELVEELDYVDVLWFPTGGGKTEAYLGLIVTALFYDRLRGKDRGVTAWMKFPLRMLSVQQLARVLRAIVAAEDIRQRELGAPGQPFELGYLVGGNNTPNKLSSYQSGWWPGLERAVARLAENPHEFDEHVIIGNCPYCDGANTVGLELRREVRRLVHVCRACNTDLPVHMSDEEVFRYLPSVVVSTVDKITMFTWNMESTSLARGPKWECPAHGYFSFGKCPVDACTNTRRQYRAVTGWKDPVPAFIVQDEMHLLREDLGTFSSHYEGLLRSLQTNGPSKLPSKIIAASATIEGFEAQLAQVYCRRPRRFPSPGWELERTFYVETTPEVRRVFLGVQPAGAAGRKVEVSGVIASELLSTAAQLVDDLDATAAAIEARTGLTLDQTELAKILFNYEVNLAFVNSKAHGSIIGDDFERLKDRLAEAGQDDLQYRTLTGEVTVPMLAEAIDLIEKADPATPRSERLRGLIGTSVVSHGVDLARLNTMVMCGLPITTADYIQATARSGRTHVGLVVTVYDNWTAREVSSFTHFISTHRFLERLVEAVPVNRWALNGVRRTLPGLAVAHIFDLAREDRFASDEELRRVAKFQPWWNRNGVEASPVIEERLLDSYRSAVPGVNPTALEDELQETARQRWRREERTMTGFDKDKIQELFREKAMTSLRDVDDQVTFSAMGQSAVATEALFGDIQESDD